MLKEVDLFGIYIAPIAFYIAIAIAVFMVIRRAIGLFGLDRFIWHSSLFDVALFVIIASLVTITATFSVG